YFVGHFDGTSFVNANAAEEVLWLDTGRDFYAPQSFFDPEGAPTIMAWASNWRYARQTPTTGFRGAASLPRQLSLTATPDGLRVAQKVPEAVTQAFSERRDRATYHHRFRLERGGAGDVSIALFGEAAPQYRLRHDPEGRVSITSVRAPHAAMPDFGYSLTRGIGWPPDRPVSVDLYVDRGLVEIFVADGTLSLTDLHFPQAPEGPLTLTHHARAAFQHAQQPLLKGGHNG
ncbi:MAG: GH32 C-terminal domain-containing protein, partial [Roseivivax sp.]|nr:GH32 C-terminal domain-containing protein [Roseivivax sp.]